MVSKRPDMFSLVDELLTQDNAPDWDSAEDLGRISTNAMVASMGSPRERSTGVLRFFGEGINGHAGSMQAIGLAMANWQKLVTSIAAARQGHKGLRGRLPAAIENAAMLDLQASPTFGSLVLTFAPRTSPADELDDADVLPTFDKPDMQVVDQAVVTALELIREGVANGPDLDEDSGWISDLSELGPRAATALASWAKHSADCSFDVDLKWSQPQKPTQRVRMTKADATWIASAISSKNLEESTETMTGDIVTISDRSNLQIEVSDGETVNVKPGKINHDDLAPLRHGDRVEITASVEFTSLPGDEPRAAYTGESIRKLS
ncbi:hypothetical protein [Kocuria oceani]|uniref:DhaL domain-containing protein n=1 Tax=Kocuria oceani TaxID=988827 RepID=A0ABV9TMX6_9MICC|nr:hypothetical protein [Kocuria oceani]